MNIITLNTTNRKFMCLKNLMTQQSNATRQVSSIKVGFLVQLGQIKYNVLGHKNDKMPSINSGGWSDA